MRSWIGVAVCLLLLAPVAASAQLLNPNALFSGTGNDSPFDGVETWESLQALAQARTGTGRGQRSAKREPSRGQALIVTANLQGGHDDNVGAASGAGLGSVPSAQAKGSTRLADVMVEYQQKSPRRTFQARALGNVVDYPNYLDRPAAGAKARARGSVELTKQLSLEYSTQFRYEPLFTTGLAEANDVIDVAGVPQTDLLGGGVPGAWLFERRSAVSSNKAYLTRRWTPRDITVVSYLFFRQKYLDDGGENGYHEAAFSYSRVFSRSISLGASYQFQRGRTKDFSGIWLPTEEHVIEGGPVLGRRFKGRQLVFATRGGGTKVSGVDTVTKLPYASWQPYARVGSSLELIKRWQAVGSYERKYAVVQGLTNQVYATDATAVTVGGPLIGQFSVTVGASISSGEAFLAANVSDSYRVSGAFLDLQIPATSKMAVSLRYSNNVQRFSDPSLLPSGFPSRYTRNAIVVGLNVWTTVIGSLPAKPRLPDEW